MGDEANDLRQELQAARTRITALETALGQYSDPGHWESIWQVRGDMPSRVWYQGDPAVIARDALKEAT